MNNVKRLFLGLMAASLAACTATPPPTPPPSEPLVNPRITFNDIELQVKQGQLQVVNSPTPGCGQGNGAKGCVVTGLANTGLVRIKLRGSGGYEMTRFWVCDGLDKPDDVETDCTLTNAGQDEFVLFGVELEGSPNAKGLVNLGGVRDFFLVNQNTFQADYFYLVEACRGGKGCLILDPRIRNGGRRVLP